MIDINSRYYAKRTDNDKYIIYRKSSNKPVSRPYSDIKTPGFLENNTFYTITPSRIIVPVKVG